MDPPNHKSQNPKPKPQNPKPKYQVAKARCVNRSARASGSSPLVRGLELGAWDFFGVWVLGFWISLEVGASSFGFRLVGQRVHRNMQRQLLAFVGADASAGEYCGLRVAPLNEIRMT